jgi:hypothetical protein
MNGSPPAHQKLNQIKWCRDLLLLVNQGLGTIPAAIPTCLLLLLKGKATNDPSTQPGKIPVVDKQHGACQRGPLLQRPQAVPQAMMMPAAVGMRVCQSA